MDCDLTFKSVLTAMSTKGTSHIDPSFIATFGESIELMRQVVLTKVRTI